MKKIEKKIILPYGISPSDPKEALKYQEEIIQKSEQSKVRSFAFERRQRLPYLITKGLSKPGTISFDILRRAATSVHAARICVNVLKEKITKTKWVIQSIDPLKKVEDFKIKQIENLFKYPNKNSETFRSFLDKVLEDLLVLDAVSIEKTRDKDGVLNGLHFVDAATIRPVFDDHGNQDIIMPITGEDKVTRNLPVSYVQVLDSNPYGGRESGQLMAVWPKKDFMYFNMHPQGSMGSFGYGLSPLEAVIGVVANILNADNFNGTYFEEGAFPPIIIQLKQNMDQRELQAIREYMYNELEGRYHRPAIIGGDADMVVNNLKDLSQRDMQFMDYMQFMVRLLAAAYGLSAQDVGLTDGENFATAKIQKDLSESKGYGSILHLLKEQFNNEIIWKDFGYEDLEFDWVSSDSLDPEVASRIYDTALKNGTMTINEVRQKSGEQPYEEWADRPMILTGEGYLPLLKQDEAKDKISMDDGKVGDNKEPYQDQDTRDLEVTKSVHSEDGIYEIYVDDRGVSNPFIYKNILTGEGFAIKPPVAVNLDSQNLEEEWSFKLFNEGLNVVPVKKMTETDIFNHVLITPELKVEFIKYQNMTPEYDSKRWEANYGHSRKYSYYMVSRYLEGRNIKDPLLIKDMQRVPGDYMQAIEDLSKLWLAEKKYVLGDRRADQYIITSEKRGWGFDYQFVGNRSRYEGTKNAIINVLVQIPDLQNKFKELTGQEDVVTKMMKKIGLKKDTI